MKACEALWGRVGKHRKGDFANLEDDDADRLQKLGAVLILPLRASSEGGESADDAALGDLDGVGVARKRRPIPQRATHG
ncbi:MAG: hypothetical protein LBD04_02830 [Synergistaceae bacterium]|nr:hypothetical protein [Synergistaceae bacterium]